MKELKLTQHLLLVPLLNIYWALMVCPERFQVPAIQLWTKKIKIPAPWSSHFNGTVPGIFYLM